MTDKAPADSTALEVHENHDNSDVGDQQLNAQYLLNSPAYMSSAVRRQLLQEMVKGLPVNVQKRINALRNIELEHLHLEAKFYEEVNEHFRICHMNDHPKFSVSVNIEKHGIEFR